MSNTREQVERLNIVRVDIIDTDYDEDNPRVMDTFYLVNPDSKKLEDLQRLINNRFDDNEILAIEQYGEIYEYISENFMAINIDTKEIHW